MLAGWSAGFADLGCRWLVSISEDVKADVYQELLK
jgi:hypothetical protein